MLTEDWRPAGFELAADCVVIWSWRGGDFHHARLAPQPRMDPTRLLAFWTNRPSGPTRPTPNPYGYGSDFRREKVNDGPFGTYDPEARLGYRRGSPIWATETRYPAASATPVQPSPVAVLVSAVFFPCFRPRADRRFRLCSFRPWGPQRVRRRWGRLGWPSPKPKSTSVRTCLAISPCGSSTAASRHRRPTLRQHLLDEQAIYAFVVERPDS